MKHFQNKARLPLCGFILLSFFLPAYAHYTAVQFISLVLASVNKAYEITSTDALIAITSLLMIPLSVFVLVVRGALRLATRRTYVAMPLVFILFFAGLLFTNLSGQSASTTFNAFGAAGPGFYLAGLSALLLLFTKSPKRKSRKRKKVADTELAV